jgi:hypothetical protein
MTNGELIKFLESLAEEYRRDAVASINRNSHSNELMGACKLTQHEVDAVLVNFINFVAMKRGMDWGLYTKDLRK